MKSEKTQVKTVEFRVWCEHCCIRIAPHEGRTLAGGKAYHPRCYLKLSPSTPAGKTVQP